MTQVATHAVDAATAGVPLVVALHVWPADARVPQPVDHLDLDWGGVVGDQHHGLTTRSTVRERRHHPPGTEIRNLRQVSIVDRAEAAEIAHRLGVPDLEPGLIGDNISTTGIPGLTAVAPMTRMHFAHGAVLVVAGENIPCTKAGGMVGARHGTAPHSFPRAAWHRRGVVAWVERPGRIDVGDAIDLRPAR